MRWNLESGYAELPDLFYTELTATPVVSPRWAVFNRALAVELGLGAEAPTDEDLAFLAGNAAPPRSRPLAQAYAGHQYGHFTMLGDGRALLLGEQRAPDGRLFDLQLKGSGPTPYSRSGDGRASLGPMLREYLMGEAMHALGIPTTRALAVVETGEDVWRETALPGAILTRVAESHLRVGTFEYASATGDLEALKRLTQVATARHFPEALAARIPALAFLEAVIEAQAKLLAQWMSVGFVHGVMNTDNMALSGQTIDYGPCAFLDSYRADQVFSSIDRQGRYSYGNQPGIARWNLTRFAEALLPLLGAQPEDAIALAQPLIDSFGARYEKHYFGLMGRKLGFEKEGPGVRDLVAGLLQWMEGEEADYCWTFRRLTDTLERPDGPPEHASSEGFMTWLRSWRQHLVRDGRDVASALTLMSQSNPRFTPRNHRVEEALDAAVSGDYTKFQALLAVLSAPFEPHPGNEELAPPPGPEFKNPYVTYCGT